MNAELKAKWLAALRSGKYKQATRTLREPDSNNYCCLGVLCALAGMKWKKDITGYYLHSQTLTPPPVKKAGLGVYEAGELAKMNDQGKSFAEIADYIEANL